MTSAHGLLSRDVFGKYLNINGKVVIDSSRGGTFSSMTVSGTIKDGTGSTLYSKVRNATVSIAINGSSCSGWFVREDGWVVSAAHCFTDGNVLGKVDITSANVLVTSVNGVSGVNRTIQPSSIYIDAAGDIAVLELPGIVSQDYLEWGNSQAASIGSKCFVVGNPLGGDIQSLSDGLVRDNMFLSYPQPVESMFISAPTFSGNSGSPIINEDCEVIGLLSFGLLNTVSNSSGVSIGTVPTETLGGGMSSRIAEQVVHYMINNETDYTIKGWLGIDFWNVMNHTAAADLGIANTEFNIQGIYLSGPSALDASSPLLSPTSGSALTDDDVILTIDGVKVGGLDGQTHLSTITWFKEAGETVTLTWIRPPDWESVNTSVITLGTFPAEDDVPLAGNLNSTSITTISPRIETIDGMPMHLIHSDLSEPSELESVIEELAATTYTYRDPSEWPGEEALMRLVPDAYGDDNGDIPSGNTRPNPRFISNTIFSQMGDANPHPDDVSDMFWLWGQFVDHDIGLTETDATDPLNISIPIGDPQFDPSSTGNVVLSFNRSKFVDGTGSGGIAREQITEITRFIDATNVYGTTTTRVNWLRSNVGGKLKVSQGDFLPINDGTQTNAMQSVSIFVAGDVRANEQTSLLAMHTLWAREHNWWCDRLYEYDSTLSDEELFQKARVMVESEMQAITFNEYLPLLIGSSNIPSYSGYNGATDTRIANEFTTAAYRLGHSLVSDVLWRLNDNYQQFALGHLALKDAFFAPYKLTNEGGLEPIFRGLAKHICQALDAKIVDALRNFLFGEPGSGGLDLAALNIQRGRDHGLPDYNTVRVALGLGAKAMFSDITSDNTVASALSTAYGGDISLIDLWVGGLAEDHVSGSMLGETFQYIVRDQFLRLRDGDEMWYENRLSSSIVSYMNSTKLKDIIERNTNITGLQTNVMVVS